MMPDHVVAAYKRPPSGDYDLGLAMGRLECRIRCDSGREIDVLVPVANRSRVEELAEARGLHVCWLDCLAPGWLRVRLERWPLRHDVAHPLLEGD